jgi:hypothetical protein
MVSVFSTSYSAEVASIDFESVFIEAFGQFRLWEGDLVEAVVRLVLDAG